MKILHLRLKAPRALFAGICLSVFLFSACGAVPDPNAPHVPKNQTETNIMNMLHKFLDSKIAGKPDDQQTCTEGTALNDLDVKSYTVTSIKNEEAHAIVMITDSKGNKQPFRFRLMAADVRNGVYCIMSWVPEKA